MPSTPLRQTILTSARRVVVKVGTQLVTAYQQGAPGLDTDFIANLARQIAELRRRGYQITFVSSGAVGAGCSELGLTERPTDLAALQAVAAIGQRRLMAHMHTAFAEHGLSVGQVLLTRADFDDRNRFLNIRNCISHLHALGAIPILNENDSVAVEELRFGDNDMLAALMCNALPAEVLILLTVVDGLLDAEGQRIDLVDHVGNSMSHARTGAESKSKWGSGGMASKLGAAKLAADAGEVAVIANGRAPDVLLRVLAGEPVGTVLMPAEKKLDARSRWIGLTRRPAGVLVVDGGAVRALVEGHKSLLATGIRSITGRFEGGEVVAIRTESGEEIARGLTHYGSEELEKIRGHHSSAFASLLGHPAYAEVIHRDNLVLLR